MPLAATSYNVPPEIAEAARRGRQQGQWIRAKCPYCDPEGRKAPSLAIGDRGWICHRGQCHKLQRDERARVALQLQRIAGDDDAARHAKALRIIEECGTVRKNCPVDLYLRSRRLVPVGAEWPADLRRHNHLWHGETKKEYVAMVAIVRDGSGMAVAVHRTYLLQDGRRADDKTVDAKLRVSNAKLSLGTLAGGHSVQLGHDVSADTIGIGEGLESTLALRMKLQLPCLSGLSANGLASIKIPKDVRRVIIGPDLGDTDMVGYKAAFALRKRIEQESSVGLRRTSVEIMAPPLRENKGDWADWAEEQYRIEEQHRRI